MCLFNYFHLESYFLIDRIKLRHYEFLFDISSDILGTRIDFDIESYIC
jgi:hypothetical protein